MLVTPWVSSKLRAVSLSAFPATKRRVSTGSRQPSTTSTCLLSSTKPTSISGSALALYLRKLFLCLRSPSRGLTLAVLLAPLPRSLTGKRTKKRRLSNTRLPLNKATLSVPTGSVFTTWKVLVLHRTWIRARLFSSKQPRLAMDRVTSNSSFCTPASNSRKTLPKPTSTSSRPSNWA